MKIKISPADKWFSLCCRAASGWKCAYTGTMYGPGNGRLHAAHIFSRRHSATRWHPLNIIPLSFGSHQKFDSDHEFHREFAIKRIGEADYTALNNLRRHIVKVSKKDKAEIAKFYRTVFEDGVTEGQEIPVAPFVRKAIRQSGVVL